jgi:aspartate/methionine/tyrosine aminotransferase
LLAMTGETPAGLGATRLGYADTRGSTGLREAIASLYPGATSEHVLVTNGSAEANFCACWRFVEPGDRVTVVLPTYMQTWGLARSFGARVTPLWLREERGWQPDPAEIDAAIAPDTRLVIVTNPNNPTGAVLSGAAADGIVRRSSEVGAWLLADEVYRGAERMGEITPSLWGRGERVLVTNSLSKAYGLPGLRIGWCVAPPPLAAELWARKDYTTIGPGAVSDALATRLLQAEIRGRIMERTRGILAGNWAVVERWLRTRGSDFTYRAPDAGAICYARYRFGMASGELAEQLRRDYDVLVVPGDQFAMGNYLRIGFGLPTPDLVAALERIGAALDALRD